MCWSCAGVVALWDVNTSQPVTEYEAHEKRIWSVDFCHTDPMLFLSGSDDGWVKVRTTRSFRQDAERRSGFTWRRPVGPTPMFWVLHHML